MPPRCYQPWDLGKIIGKYSEIYTVYHMHLSHGLFWYHRSPRSRSRSEKFLKSSTFGAVKRSGNPFLEDLLDLYMDLERILERFISKKFLWFRIGKTRI